jgi:quercetin dioxygenase-like cupin family protein
MAYKGKVISNPKTGQLIKFIQTSKDTNGSLLEMESVFQPYSAEPAKHYHPLQEEQFIVLEGIITVRLNGKVKKLSKGERLTISPNSVHSMWNETGSRTLVNWKVSHALDTEYFFETAMGIATNQQTNNLGMPKLLQVSLLANKYSHVFRLAKPPFILQQIIFAILKPVALLARYKSFYKEYIN